MPERKDLKKISRWRQAKRKPPTANPETRITAKPNNSNLSHQERRRHPVFSDNQPSDKPTAAYASVIKMSSDGRLPILLLLLFGVYISHSEDFFDTCSRYTSFGYGYRDFFELTNTNFSSNQLFYLEFYVKTGSDAHVLLKPDLSAEEGYEIVIGGGSNTFSQIRLIEPETKKTMISQKTDNFLSADDYRNFWISIDNLGIISVGKKEGDEIFINWRFDQPLPVKFFSFGSWTNLKADWRFGCELTSGVIHKEGPMTPLKKLKRDLFSFYDPNALPVEKKAVLEVKVNLQIHNVQLNEKRGDFTVYGSGDLKWIDGKLKWKPENYEGIENIFVPPYLIWTPSIRVLNALAMDRSPLFDLTTSGVMVKYDGSIFWRPPFKSLSHCTVDLKYWPYDVHNCSVLLGFWMEPSNLILSMMEQYDTLPEERTESEWQIMRAIPFNTHHPDEEENYGILYVELKRANGPQIMVITAPYAAAVTLTLVSFWLPLQSSLKLHLMFASIVLLLLLLFLAGELVPAMTQGVPIIINLYSWTVVISCIPIILYVILKNVQSSMEIPDWLSRILSNSIFARMFCLPNLNEISMEYSNLNDDVNKLNRNRLDSLRLVTVIERLFFLGYLIAIILLCILV